MPEWPIGTALKAVVDRNANRGFESRPLCAMQTTPSSTTTYRLDRRFALQIFGWRMILAGVFAMLTFLASGLGGWGWIVGWSCGALALIVFIAAIWTMAVPPLVVALDAQGFRLGRAVGGSIRRGHWMSVEKVGTDPGPAGTRLVFTLDSGETGDVALLLLPRRANELQREVHERLNTANGYRRLN